MKKIEKILESITAVILLVMLICCLLRVLFRFVLHISAPFTEEFARMGYIWMVFLTLPLLEAKNEQLKVTFFFDKIPMAIRAVLYWVISVAYVVLLVFTASFDAGNQLLTGIAADVAGAANACVCVFCLQIGSLNIS